MKFEHSKKSQAPQDKIAVSKDLAADTHGKFDLKKEVFSFVEVLLFSLVAVSMVITFIGRMTPVDGHSMNPTLKDKDKIITTSFNHTFKRNDIVTVRRKDNTPLVKRIIAVEGDKIDIDFETGKVYLNDKLLNEPFINEPTHERENFSGPVTVPKGHVFVMGDNRNFSDDSRSSKVGMIDVRNIFGKVVFRVFPLKTFGFIK